nr:amidohydrolase family protein [Pyrinomonadaceae bacterium]
MRINFFVAVFLLFSIQLFAQTLTADLVVINANVRTIDTAKPKAQAIAVVDNKIVAVGTNAEIQKIVAVGTNAEIQRLQGKQTKIVNAQGKLVIPGFNDAHVHFLEGGFQLSSVDLRDAKSPEEFAKRIKDFAAKLPKGRWILGGNWDHENWTPNNLPTKELIDAVTPDNPVFINRLDGHMSLANSLALKLANVDKNVKDVEGGEIVRDKDGNLTGILKESAQNY